MHKRGARLGVEFTLGVCFATIMFGCVSAAFTYKFYGMDMVSYDGFLRGPKPTDDLKAEVCIPTDSNKSPCTIMLTDDFYAFKLDYMDIQEKLTSCERSK